MIERVNIGRSRAALRWRGSVRYGAGAYFFFLLADRLDVRFDALFDALFFFAAVLFFFLPPPVCLLTVAQARFAAVLDETPRFL